jgi:hypothetical protein
MREGLQAKINTPKINIRLVLVLLAPKINMDLALVAVVLVAVLQNLQ